MDCPFDIFEGLTNSGLLSEDSGPSRETSFGPEMEYGPAHVSCMLEIWILGKEKKKSKSIGNKNKAPFSIRYCMFIGQ